MDKVGMIIWFVHTQEYEKLYGKHIPLWIFWTPKGDKRRDELLHLIEEKLTAIYQPEKAVWFRVSSCPLSADMFFAKVWITPSQRKAVSLLSPASRV